MGDRYASFAHTGPGRALVRRLGLPEPPKLHRYQPGDPLISGPVLVAAAGDGELARPVTALLTGAGVEVASPPTADLATPPQRRLYAGLVFDATAIHSPTGLRALYDFFHPHLRSLYPNGRVVVLGRPPITGSGADLTPAVAGAAEAGGDDRAAGLAAATAQRALEGFTRSLGKEVGRGSTVQLVQVPPGAEGNLEATLRFLLSARSAYVSGQVIRLSATPASAPADWRQPLAGKLAVVTGAAGGIGAATAQVLARDGASVVCVDLATAGESLAAVANQVGGTALQLDLTAPTAPRRLTSYLSDRHGQVDLVVHNAGITRDRTLPKLPESDWQAVLDLNLLAVFDTTAALLDAGLVSSGGRLVLVSSVTGLAGNRGQTNYATAKAGLLGMVEALAPELAGHEITVNAVAPGFIETRLTTRMPALPREFGRRMNSLAQAGLPVDVAETIGWLGWPGTEPVNGQVVRVCGQSLLGA